MWDEIMDMPGEIFDMGDGSFMTDEDIAEGKRILNENGMSDFTDISLTFDEIVAGMCEDPEFIAQCERNNRLWDQEAAAELGMTLDELHTALGIAA
jgi:hypothetical protein